MIVTINKPSTTLVASDNEEMKEIGRGEEFFKELKGDQTIIAETRGGSRNKKVAVNRLTAQKRSVPRNELLHKIDYFNFIHICCTSFIINSNETKTLVLLFLNSIS